MNDRLSNEQQMGPFDGCKPEMCFIYNGGLRARGLQFRSDRLLSFAIQVMRILPVHMG